MIIDFRLNIRSRNYHLREIRMITPPTVLERQGVFLRDLKVVKQYLLTPFRAKE